MFYNPNCITIFYSYHCTLTTLLSKRISPHDVNCARNLITDFVKYFGLIYGKITIWYNVHSVLHIPDDVHYFQAPFDFESYQGKMVKMIRTPNRPLAQIVRRLSEIKTLFYEKNAATSETELQLSNFRISLINSQDGFTLIRNGTDDGCINENKNRK